MMGAIPFTQSEFNCAICRNQVQQYRSDISILPATVPVDLQQAQPAGFDRKPLNLPKEKETPVTITIHLCSRCIEQLHARSRKNEGWYRQGRW